MYEEMRNEVLKLRTEYDSLVQQIQLFDEEFKKRGGIFNFRCVSDIVSLVILENNITQLVTEISSMRTNQWFHWDLVVFLT